MRQRETTPKTDDERRSFEAGALMGVGAAVLVMIPSLYRLLNGPFQWVDAALVAGGTGLIVFHIARLVRLRRSP